MPEVGIISKSEREVDLVVEWKIENFFTLWEKDGAYYTSPSFSFGGYSCYLVIFPNGSSQRDSYGHVDLRLVKFSSDHSIQQAFSIFLKTAKGEKYNEQHCTKDFEERWDYHAFHRFIPRSELSRRQSELVPNGVLTIVCTIEKTTSAGSASATSTAECPHCKLTLEAASMPTHERSCMDRPMKCPQCGEDIATKLWLDHKCLTARTNAIGNLLHDFKRLMVCGEHSDVTVSVRGEEFRLHRGILGVRNPFFGSRFNNDSQETTPGTLSIEDCDPDQFRTLIHYIYTGTADNLCPENVCGLYEVALAYQEPQMRAECLQLMMNTLSVDNFCDYTVLALKHDQEELLQKVNELFVHKVKEITRHEKWEAFLESYPAQANKLYKKALDQYDEK